MHFHKFLHHENFEFITSLNKDGSFRSGRTKRTVHQRVVAPDWAVYRDGLKKGCVL